MVSTILKLLSIVIYATVYVVACTTIKNIQQANAQSSLICAKDTEFKACVNKYTLKIANCGTLVKSTPGLEFYECQCTAYTEMDQCYWLCPDDAALQGQFRDEKLKNTSTACSQVVDLKNQGFKSSTSMTVTKTVTTQVSKTKSDLPAPTAGNGSGAKDNANTDNIGNKSGNKSNTQQQGPIVSQPQDVTIPAQGTLDLNKNHGKSTVPQYAIVAVAVGVVSCIM